jgi:hypothetical protein
MKKLLIILLFLFHTNSWLSAQQATASAGTYTLKIGEQTDITLTAKPLKGDQVKWPELSDSLGPHFSIVSKAKPDTLRDSTSGLSSYRQLIRITSFDTGVFTLPIFDFTFIKPSGDSISVISDALSIEVKSVPVDTTLAIKDIKGVQEIPFEIAEFIPWIFAGLAIAALIIAAIYVWIRRRKPQKPSVPAVAQLPPWEKALLALQKTQQEKRWAQGQEKLYHSEISDILRLYIEEQFGLPALESTSDETLRMCSRHAALRELENVLKQILELADLVKFAKVSPLPAEHEQSLTLAFRFVNETRPVNQGKEDKHA